ncbi:MAG: hypothetical protein NC037_01940 [Bacteroides sp.]|nr:hypothetical protein [Bacillota bacterium]MCM1394214.1 hypothetical protein [[Eubacterium] siraeum]MCM1455276.1 hypothetical protein [Bacteroides sp.]
MAKFRKKLIFVVILALCLALSLTLVACNDGKDDKPPADNGYSVTVKIGETPQSGVKVTLSKDGIDTSEDTGADGKASFGNLGGEWVISLSNLPKHYVVPEGTYTLTDDNRSKTITLIQEDSYIVRLKNPDGTAFYQDEVAVVMCDFTGNCKSEVYIDQNGVAYLFWEEDNYHVKVVGLGLEGYIYESNSEGYYSKYDPTSGVTDTVNLTATVKEMTITIYPIEEVVTALNNDQKDTYNIDHAQSAYKISATVPVGKSFYFSYTTGSLTSEYTVYKSNSVPVINMGTVFDLSATSNTMYGGYSTCALEANQTYYFRVSNEVGEEPVGTQSTIQFEFVIVVPLDSYVKHSGVAGTIDATVSNDHAVIEFSPTQSGYYTFTTLGNAEAYIDVSTISEGRLFHELNDSVYPPSLTPITIADNQYKKNFTTSVKVTEDLNGDLSAHTIYLGIKVKSDAAVSLQVSIAREGGRLANVGPIEVKAPDNLVKEAEPEAGKELEFVGYDTNIVYNDTDGKYHYGSESGDVVYVLLTKPLDTWSENASLAWYELANNTSATSIAGISFICNVTSTDDLADKTKGNTYNDYRLFLRGFYDYKIEYGIRNTYSVPEALDKDNCYAAMVNNDGAYCLTAELMDFLQKFAKHNSNTLSGILNDTSADPSNYWKFALYRYVTPAPVDQIVGAYEFHSLFELDDESGDIANRNIDYLYWGVTLSKDTYRLTVNKNGTFTISELGQDNEYETIKSGSWTKDAGTEAYTFAENGRGAVTYDEVEFNSETGYLKLYHNADPTDWLDVDAGWEFYLIAE